MVAGASEGIGRAFALQLAERRLNLVLLARREAPLRALARELEDRFGVRVRVHSVDLGSHNLCEQVAEVASDLEVGLLVYNAALSTIGEFTSTEVAPRLRELDVNCRGPLMLAHQFAGPMVQRKRGGLILLSSLSGYQGSALVSSYAATKAFNTVLAEGLWEELREHGVDVLGCVAGATRTPTYEASKPREAGALAAPMEAEQVAVEALRALGRTPTVVPGRLNRVAALAMRWMPRARAIGVISAATRKMYG